MQALGERGVLVSVTGYPLSLKCRPTNPGKDKLFLGKIFVFIQKLSKIISFGQETRVSTHGASGDQWVGHPGQVTVGQPQADGGRSADPRAPAGARRRVY